jgi:hypothetical protein
MCRDLVLVLLVLAIPATPALAQESPTLPSPSPQPNASIQRFEVGIAVSDLHAGCVTGNQGCPSVAGGVGAAINLNRRFALDANVNFTSYSAAGSNFTGGRLSDYLFGVRLETRAKHYGYFIKAQPGLANWSHAVMLAVPIANGIDFTFNEVGRFVTEVDGGFEYSPTSRIHLRAEGGDLFMHYSQSTWDSNLHASVGVYVGLGKPISFAPPTYDARAAHRFFDPMNDVLLLGSALAWTADSILTHRAVAEGWSEGDPFAKPFVKYGWPGQIAGGGLEMSSEVLAMYGAHRIHKHWLERLIPVGVAMAHGVCAYQNTKASSKGPQF